jgi:hypothetical protein
MSLRDPFLEKKVEIKSTISSKINNLRTEDPKAASAARASNRVSGSKLNTDKQALELIQLIDAATQKGYYILANKILPAAVNGVGKYFKNKGYIVATNDKKNVIVICWMGGTIWRKLNFGSNKVDSTIENKLFDEIKASVIENLRKLEPNTKKIVGLSPNGTWDAPKLKRVWMKLK